MQQTPASRILLFSLFVVSCSFTACGGDDDESSDAGSEQDASAAGSGGLAAGGGGAAGQPFRGSICQSDARPWSQYCQRYSNHCGVTFSELRDEFCRTGCSGGSCAGKQAPIDSGDNSCGGMTLADNRSLTVYKYHFDGEGLLIGVKITSDTCDPRLGGEIYGEVCAAQNASRPLDCGPAPQDAGMRDAGSNDAG